MTVPSTPEERIETVTRHWLDVMGSYHRDMAGTTTAAEARAVEDNYNAAERTYLDAVESGLTKTEPAADEAHAALVRARHALAEARARIDAFADILNKLSAATEAATRLVRAAS
jgi:hypothetical protein